MRNTYIMYLEFHHPIETKVLPSLITDIDECNGENSCDANAKCDNTEGGYKCTCKDGYTGTGDVCYGKSNISARLIVRLIHIAPFT